MHGPIYAQLEPSTRLVYTSFRAQASLEVLDEAYRSLGVGRTVARANMLSALQKHWPEYLFEAFGLGLFMLSACLCTALLEYHGSPVHQAIASAAIRRAFSGLGMGLTATGIVYSLRGASAPARTSILRLRCPFCVSARLRPRSCVLHISAVRWQYCRRAAREIHHPEGNRGPGRAVGATVPGECGVVGALLAELIIAFVLMTVVLTLGSFEKTAPFAGGATGTLACIFCGFEPKPLDVRP